MFGPPYRTFRTAPCDTGFKQRRNTSCRPRLARVRRYLAFRDSDARQRLVQSTRGVGRTPGCNGADSERAQSAALMRRVLSSAAASALQIAGNLCSAEWRQFIFAALPTAPSRGLAHRPFAAVARIRIPLGSLWRSAPGQLRVTDRSFRMQIAR